MRQSHCFNRAEQAMFPGQTFAPHHARPRSNVLASCESNDLVSLREVDKYRKACKAIEINFEVYAQTSASR
jgi:hypothetical protein